MFVVLTALVALAGSSAPAPEVLTFASGLRVVLQATPGAPRVTAAAVVGVGSIDDPQGQEGLAHMVEHAWFRSHAGDHEVQTVLASHGCEHNPFTSPTWTTYLTACPSTEVHRAQGRGVPARRDRRELW